MDPQLSECQALELSSGEKCHKEATHADGLFCWFHSKQVYGLYLGYKRRNARLDVLDNNAPDYLASSKIPLANQTFQDVDEETTLHEVHVYLFEKYNLIGRVIDARRLHHKHFYSLTIDYGHQAYLDKLNQQRHTVLRALERLDKRIANVLYEKEQWFAWARQAQDEEEANRDKEQKKIKQEAALFKRHWKVIQARLERKRQKEEKKRHNAYLEEAYQERKAMDAAEDDGDEAWDPIDDEDLDKRHQYVDLIKHFLWMEVLGNDQHGSATDLAVAEKPEESVPASEASSSTKKPKKKGKKGAASKAGADPRGSKTHDRSEHGQEILLAMQEAGSVSTSAEQREPDKKSIETEEEMKRRLKEGAEKDYSESWGPKLVGSLENPHETYEKTAPMSDDDVETAAKEVKEIKLLLFCRLVLAHASLLPAALRASNVEDFLQDAEITDSDLRDLCLKVEFPTLQNIRDACADFARGDELADDEDEAVDEEEEQEDFEDLINGERRYQHLHTSDWFLDHLLKGQKHVADLGKSKKSKKKKKKLLSNKKTKVTICGKTIWNHASEKAMSRDGWLQFSIMAKDCDLKYATQLCRNWNEFSDLSLLAMWQFFPASNWASWNTNQMVEQLQQLEFFPYFIDNLAQKHSHHHQVGGRGQARRQHDIIEARNIIVGHMKRNDSVTRRFLQYLTIRTGEVLVMVRDGKTGRVITAPPKEHLWTYRRKAGLGRASKNEWHNVLEVGPQFFDLNDKLRQWRFGFDDYYDVYIWDFVPCQNSNLMYNTIITELRNAWRLTNPRDLYLHMEPMLRTLTREKETMRTRKVKPGEDVKTLWDVVMSDSSEFVLFEFKGKDVRTRGGSELAKDPYLFYNEANVAEDQVLFPDELVSKRKNVPFREIRNAVNRLETGIMKPQMRGWGKIMDFITQSPTGTITKGGDLEEDKLEEEEGRWSMPEIWVSGLDALCEEMYEQEVEDLIMRTGVTEVGTMTADEHHELSDQTEVMERERSFGFKETFHEGDFEPGATAKFKEVKAKIRTMLGHPHVGSVDWVWFIIRIFDWAGIQADAELPNDPNTPWPHSFVIHDMVEAFAAMAMFFPDLEVTSLVTRFIQSDQCESFRNSLLFDPRERGKAPPDRRSRTSYQLRDSKFWDAWNKVWDGERYFTQDFPMDWSIAIRPIIAQLYRVGVIAPVYAENDREIILGVATANTEPHRPDKLDLFINYRNPYCRYKPASPPNCSTPDKWPKLLPLAQKFAGKHAAARFALIRLWSAPHFYPLMVGPGNRRNTSFLDSVGRPWEWKFAAKDMIASEFIIHHLVETRLQYLRKQIGDRVEHRGDLVLVMAENSEELLKYSTVVTFALQTRPWLREVDLWKSFINVELDVLEGLDPFWLE